MSTCPIKAWISSFLVCLLSINLLHSSVFFFFFFPFIIYIQRIFLDYIQPNIFTLFNHILSILELNFIVDHTRSSLLNWGKRLEIVIGITRGILYLHQDSRLRIIHRDLKTSNVLLDGEMNPKISDFGIARIFKGDQIQDKTTRVIGT